MKRFIPAFMFMVLCWQYMSAQGFYFYVQLTDKNNSPYSLSEPLEYLSERSIERRTFFDIPTDSTDLPINPNYIDEIEGVGVQVHCRSKWLNGVTVLTNDTTLLSKVRALSFVKYAEYTGQTFENKVSNTSYKPVKSLEYGEANRQIQEMNGQVLHDAGFEGTGMQIAVIDAGFYAVNSNPGFALLRNEGRILGTKDFVNPLSDIYSEHSHGASVLSTMGGVADNSDYVGSAYKASYWLLRTEANMGEYPCEADFWMSAIEYADSVGADVATTSLGYYEFDDANLNYTQDMLDGKTLRASLAANIATKKGMMLLNAAGNEGSKNWKKICVPSDADGVITVGGVAADSTMAFFSSYGYTADERVKPELCARGQGAILLNHTGNVVSGNGTSFATPLLAGLTACYIQAAKAKNIDFTLQELRNYMFESAHLYATPTTHSGYGIPNFKKALQRLEEKSGVGEDQTSNLSISVRHGEVCVSLPTFRINQIRLFDFMGQLLFVKKTKSDQVRFIPSIPNGIYLIQVELENKKNFHQTLILR